MITKGKRSNPGSEALELSHQWFSVFLVVFKVLLTQA